MEAKFLLALISSMMFPSAGDGRLIESPKGCDYSPAGFAVIPIALDNFR